ncbi:dlpC [Symbiodinium sp. CCMP2592]|nr:dlpC [Symbiodinium sp. CCMP2592]
MASVGAKSDLLNVLGDVKARVQDKLGIVDFPMPQFILIGRQSVGKSRLIEALAGECFNFISGTLGSRRPTVLEFRHAPTFSQSRWFVRDRKTNHWVDHPVDQVMKIVGDAHEECGTSVSHEPIYVRIESSKCVDMQIVDLPGFRDFAIDTGKQDLADKIESLVMSFMKDKRNVMLCVEQAGDAATMSTLAKCRALDPDLKRTVLIRNKLDKYYSDLTPDNVSKWVDGFGDLPDSLVRFAMTLPWWPDTSPMPKPFNDIKDEKDTEDRNQMASKGLSDLYMGTIGFRSFVKYMEKKIEQMFADAIDPVLTNLKDLKSTASQQKRDLETEYNDTDPHRILSTTRDCGISFATALTHVMEGVLDLQPVMNLDEELRAFHTYHQTLGSAHFSMLPSEDFCSLNDYIDYLRNEIQIGAFDVEVNGGAQFRRLMMEVEIFLRFSEIAVEIKKRDVIQARGVSMSSLTWRDVVVKLLSHEAHLPLQRRVAYVGERIKWLLAHSWDRAVFNFSAWAMAPPEAPGQMAAAAADLAAMSDPSPEPPSEHDASSATQGAPGGQQQTVPGEPASVPSYPATPKARLVVAKESSFPAICLADGGPPTGDNQDIMDHRTTKYRQLDQSRILAMATSHRLAWNPQALLLNQTLLAKNPVKPVSQFRHDWMHGILQGTAPVVLFQSFQSISEHYNIWEAMGPYISMWNFPGASKAGHLAGLFDTSKVAKYKSSQKFSCQASTQVRTLDWKGAWEDRARMFWYFRQGRFPILRKRRLESQPFGRPGHGPPYGDVGPASTHRRVFHDAGHAPAEFPEPLEIPHLTQELPGISETFLLNKPMQTAGIGPAQLGLIRQEAGKWHSATR